MRFISSKYIVLFAAAARGSVSDENCDSEIRSAIRASHSTLTSGHVPDVGKLGAAGRLGDCPEAYQRAFTTFIERYASLYRDMGINALEEWLIPKTRIDRMSTMAKMRKGRKRDDSAIAEEEDLIISGFWKWAKHQFVVWGQEIDRSLWSPLESRNLDNYISALEGSFDDMATIEDQIFSSVGLINSNTEDGHTTPSLRTLAQSKILALYKERVETLVGHAADLCAIATDYNETAMKEALGKWASDHWLIKRLVTVLNHMGPVNSGTELSAFVNEYVGTVIRDKPTSVYRRYNQLVLNRKENAMQVDSHVFDDEQNIHDSIIVAAKFITIINNERIEMNKDSQFSLAKALALRQRIYEAESQAHAELFRSGNWIGASMGVVIDDATVQFEHEIDNYPIHHDPTMNGCDVGVQKLVCLQAAESTEGGFCTVSSTRENLDASRDAESMFKDYVGIVLKEFIRSAKNRNVVRNQSQGLDLLRKYLVAVERARVTLSHEFPSIALHMHQFFQTTLMEKKPMIDRWVMDLPLAIESGLDASVGGEVDFKIEPLVTVKLVNGQHPECEYSDSTTENRMVVYQPPIAFKPENRWVDYDPQVAGKRMRGPIGFGGWRIWPGYTPFGYFHGLNSDIKPEGVASVSDVSSDEGALEEIS